MKDLVIGVDMSAGGPERVLVPPCPSASPLIVEPAQTPSGIRKRPSVHATAWTEGLGLLGTFTISSSVEQRGPDMSPEREHLPWLDAAA